MDVLGVNMKNKRQAKRSKKAIKVVYISSPMKVQTSASKFRALVQELTGKDSDAARFMDVNGGDQNLNSSPEILDQTGVDGQGSFVPSLMNSCNDSSSTSPDSDFVFESLDRYLPPMEGSFMSMFQSNLFHEYSSHELDVFN
ncbi:hypothetical protein JCGZ_24548 [Jatropha curcas]|uniref:VQ domain-containing protein n=1 Tax=Jatropha curcas TaxID=180498 RepID=A0A067L8W8_JATCU|nr:uncharacterized protein LOC105631246 [Jatropha curcas]KDP40549.1 hypothetical protein JCGZ_24548 [Jatropha curcas]